MNQRGFTVIELLGMTVLLIVVGVVFWTQKNNIEVASRDDNRKISINALYYGLEEVYFPTNKLYPKTISAATVPSIDPELLKDPNGKTIGLPDSDYRYEGKNCTDDSCKSYRLWANLENEADFVKDSRNK